MKKTLLGLAMLLALIAGRTVTAADDTGAKSRPTTLATVYTVEGDKFPDRVKLKVGDTIRLHASAAKPKGTIQVTATGGTVTASASTKIVNGRISATGTNDRVYDVKATKTGKLIITVKVTGGEEPTTTKYEIPVGDSE